MNKGKSFTTKKSVLSLSKVRKLFTPMGMTGSSMSYCNPSFPCSRSTESCIVNKCMRPIVGWNKWQGLGMMHRRSTRTIKENGVNISYPSLSEHGGSQTGIRNKFFLKYHNGKAIIILTNGEGSWTDSLGNKRGADFLINEIYHSFSKAYSF